MMPSPSTALSLQSLSRQIGLRETSFAWSERGLEPGGAPGRLLLSLLSLSLAMS